MTSGASGSVPVIALTGYLGAGKTTVLNHALRQPGARLGIVVNDFGAINVDAALVTGQVDEPASIAGGCLCCLPEAGGLDQALERLTQPRLRLDAVIVEASGIADPIALARLIRASAVERVRPGGVVEVVDAVEYFATVDTRFEPPARFAACTLVVVNKIDRVPAADRERVLARITERIRLRNPDVLVVPTSRGRIDPGLIFDTADTEDAPDELPLAALARDQYAERAHEHVHHGDGEPRHDHADAVTVPAAGAVSPGAIIDLLEQPPAGVYRMKGQLRVRTGRTTRRYLVNLVGRSIHVVAASDRAEGGARDGQEGLVAIGVHLDAAEVQARLEAALHPSGDTVDAAGLRRLQRYRRLSA